MHAFMKEYRATNNCLVENRLILKCLVTFAAFLFAMYSYLVLSIQTWASRSFIKIVRFFHGYFSTMTIAPDKTDVHLYHRWGHGLGLQTP